MSISDPRPDMFVEERPWGRFEQLVCNQPATVKIITVLPGCRLSLQTHAGRAEFWRVLDGTVDLTVGEETRPAGPGDEAWIPIGAIHRIGNSGEAPARILEIAFGDFDEGDIVRLDDDYHR